MLPGMHRLITPLLALLLFVSTAPAQEPSFHGSAGLQLWTLRDLFKTDVPGTLDKIKALGFTEVETAGLYGKPAAELKAMLTERGLKPISAHFQYDALTKDLDASIQDAKTLGVLYVAVPWIPHEIGSFSEADARRASADFNRWGEAFKKAGITFTYHPHGYEFRPHNDGTLFDIIAAETKPEFVSFEMDVLWVFQPGQDPAKLLAKYPTRWVLMHLKDMRKGARRGVYTGQAPKTDDVPLGAGQVNWPEVLAAAHRVGVKHYFIEDESPTAEAQVRESLTYLGTLKAKP